MRAVGLALALSAVASIATSAACEFQANTARDATPDRDGPRADGAIDAASDAGGPHSDAATDATSDAPPASCGKLGESCCEPGDVCTGFLTFCADGTCY